MLNINIPETLLKKIYHIAHTNNIDYRLLLATAKAESNFNNYAHRPEPQFYKKYMKDNESGWINEYKKIFKNIQTPSEDLLIHIFSSSYGMCQLMYTTALSNGFRGCPQELYNEDINLQTAARFLRHLYSKFPEIRTSHIERMKFTIAAYNAGRGNINSMLRLCRAYYNISINQDGDWQKWDIAKEFLNKVTGNNADITIKHIERIIDILVI